MRGEEEEEEEKEEEEVSLSPSAGEMKNLAGGFRGKSFVIRHLRQSLTIFKGGEGTKRRVGVGLGGGGAVGVERKEGKGRWKQK